MKKKKVNYSATHTYELKHGSIEVKNVNIPNILEEHFDAVAKNNSIEPMKKPTITKNYVIRQMNKIKERKAPGPDGMKSELRAGKIMTFFKKS